MADSCVRSVLQDAVEVGTGIFAGANALALGFTWVGVLLHVIAILPAVSGPDDARAATGGRGRGSAQERGESGDRMRDADPGGEQEVERQQGAGRGDDADGDPEGAADAGVEREAPGQEWSGE